jgi:hypothetical protein
MVDDDGMARMRADPELPREPAVLRMWRPEDRYGHCYLRATMCSCESCLGTKDPLKLHLRKLDRWT